MSKVIKFSFGLTMKLESQLGLVELQTFIYFSFL